VDILETHHWAESLKSEIPRLLAENLARLLRPARVSGIIFTCASRQSHAGFLFHSRACSNRQERVYSSPDQPLGASRHG
jgi:hypothetical protein